MNKYFHHKGSSHTRTERDKLKNSHQIATTQPLTVSANTHKKLLQLQIVNVVFGEKKWKCFYQSVSILNYYLLCAGASSILFRCVHVIIMINMNQQPPSQGRLLPPPPPPSPSAISHNHFVIFSFGILF